MTHERNRGTPRRCARRPLRRARRPASLARDDPLRHGGDAERRDLVVPLLWAVFRSLQPSDLVTAYPTWKDFSHLTFSNYSAIFGGDIDLWRYVANSLMVAFGTGVLVTVVSTLAGCGLARFRFRGSNLVFAVILVSSWCPFRPC